MLSLEITITGRVFLISTPMVGSRFATRTSPRFTSTTGFLRDQNLPGLLVAQFPLIQQVTFLFCVALRAPVIVSLVVALQLPTGNRVKEGGEHARDHPATPCFRNNRVGPLHQVSGK